MSSLRAALLLALPACGSLEYYDPDLEGKDGSSTVVDALSPAPDGGDADADADADGDTEVDTDEPTDTDTDTDTVDTDTQVPTTPTDTGTVPTDPGTTTTTPPAPVVLALDSVSPDFGPNSGGTRVTVTGTFDPATSIEFDGVAGTVVSYSDTLIEVDTPGNASDGWVDVRAVSDVRSATLPGSYQYWVDGAGSSGTFGWLTYVHVVGGYWTGAPQDGAGGAFAFTQPAAWEVWKDYTPVMGTCAFNYASAPAPTFYDPGASYVELSSGAASPRFDAVAGTPGAFAPAAALRPGIDVLPGATYDLDPVAGGPDWPGFGLSGAVEVPPAFTVTLPDMDRNNLPVVTENFTLNWNGAAGDYVLIYILRQYSDLFGWHNDGTVTCAVPDTGSFTMPLGVWPRWFNNDLLHIQVGRAIESTAILPNNDADNRMVGIYWYYGGGDTTR